MLNNDEIISIAVQKAQQIAREEGLKIGQTVAHPSDKLTYELRSIRGNIAVIGLTAEQSPDGEPIEKEFPLGELFDPNVAKRNLYSC